MSNQAPHNSGNRGAAGPGGTQTGVGNKIAGVTATNLTQNQVSSSPGSAPLKSSSSSRAGPGSGSVVLVNSSQYPPASALNQSGSSESSALSNSPKNAKLASVTRTDPTFYHRVGDMAKIIQEELQDHTYILPNLIFRLFYEQTQQMLLVRSKHLLPLFKNISSNYRPPFWNDFFGILSTPFDVGNIASWNANVAQQATPAQNQAIDVVSRIKDDNAAINDPEGHFAFLDHISVASDPLDGTFSDPFSGSSILSEPGEHEELSDERLFQLWFNILAEALDNEMTAKGLSRSKRRYYAGHSTTPVFGVTPEKRKPDLVLINGDDHRPVSPNNWRFIFTVIEITRSPNFPDRTIEEASQRAALILHNSPGRRFVPILLISAKEFMVLVYHRSGLSQSTKFDMIKHEAVFYFTLAGFLFSSPYALGLDPNITAEPNNILNPKKIKFKNVSFTIVGIIYVREGIQGRGTVCWIVRNDETGKEYMMKMVWVDVNRGPNEVDLLEEIRGHRVNGVPVLVAYEDSRDSDVVDTTARWRPEGNQKFQVRTYRKILLDGIGRPITDFSSKAELLSAIIDILEVHKYLFYVVGILHRDLSLSNMFLIDFYPEYPSQSTTSAIKTGPAMPNSSANAAQSPVRSTHAPALPQTKRSAGQAPSSSLNFSAAAASGQQTLSSADDVFGGGSTIRYARGMLGDYDYAARTSQRQPEGSDGQPTVSSPPVDDNLSAEEKKELEIKWKMAEIRRLEVEKRLRARTGTLPYMAIEVLLGAPPGENSFHRYQDDIESIIYGLMDICINFEGPRGAQRVVKAGHSPAVYSGTTKTPPEIWTMPDQTWVQIGILKSATWAHLDEWVLPHFHEYFNDMKDLFVELEEKFWPLVPNEEGKKMSIKDYNRRVNSPASYDDIIKVFKKYRDIVKEPDGSIIPPGHSRYRPPNDPGSSDHGSASGSRHHGRMSSIEEVLSHV